MKLHFLKYFFTEIKYYLIICFGFFIIINSSIIPNGYRECGYLNYSGGAFHLIDKMCGNYPTHISLIIGLLIMFIGCYFQLKKKIFNQLNFEILQNNPNLKSIVKKYFYENLGIMGLWLILFYIICPVLHPNKSPILAGMGAYSEFIPAQSISSQLIFFILFVINIILFIANEAHYKSKKQINIISSFLPKNK